MGSPTALLTALVVGTGLFGSAGCSSVGTAPDAPAAATRQVGDGRTALLTEVTRELDAMETTHYQHHTDVDEDDGTFDYDCSGLLDYALGRVLPADREALPTSTSSRPLAADIEHHLETPGTAGPWRAVPTVADLRPGDVVAWLATEDSATADTGHVMVVRDAPRRDPDDPNQWLVPVIDSTISPHARDSRHDGETGLGTGTIGLAVDRRGSPTAFAWRGGLSPRLEPTEIALGTP